MPMFQVSIHKLVSLVLQGRKQTLISAFRSRVFHALVCAGLLAQLVVPVGAAGIGDHFSSLPAALNPWMALGAGLNSQVVDIAVSSTGDVYPAGVFVNAGGFAAADFIGRWDGTSWSALGTTSLNGSLHAVEISETDEIYIGGVFTNAGGNAYADYIARWNGASWSALGTIPLSNDVYSLAVHGNDVYAGGFFLNAGGDPNADRIARWNGSSWSAVGGPLSANVFSIAIHEATGDVYAGGGFTNAGGDGNADYIARWDGTSWSALGTTPFNASVWAVAIDEATGDVYAGGYFTNAGGDPNADYIARWDGTSWSALGTTPVTPLLYPLYAQDIEIRGTEVYAGFVTGGGGESAMFIGKWDGSAWSDPGAAQLTYGVRAVEIHGTSLYAAGDFKDAGGDPNGDYIARLELPPLPDTTAPTVETFTVPAISGSLDVPITAFSASDNVAVTGYLVTESSSVPAAEDDGWSATPPTFYIVGAEGSQTLYPWAKDAAGNVSAVFGSPASVLVDTSRRCYVDETAAGANNGLSWTNAYTDLQSALGDTGCPVVWVAAGTYRPTSSTDRTISFALRNGVSVYGGFAGSETQLSQRDPAAHETILSGDIGEWDSVIDNSYHVVYFHILDNTTTLDGFTITGGNASSGNSPYHLGGGAYVWGGAPKLTNLIFEHNYAGLGGAIAVGEGGPALTNVIIRNNAANVGGGMHNFECIMPFTNVTFLNNSAREGGAIYNDHCSPEMTNVTFTGNTATAGSGGAIYNKVYSNLVLADVTFTDNSARDDGGGIYNSFDSDPTLNGVTFNGNSATRGGGIYNDSNESVLTDVTFTGNSAVSGGGMYNFFYSYPTLSNVTFQSNTATADGGGIYNEGSGVSLTRVSFINNLATNGGGMYNRTNVRISLLSDVVFWNNAASVSGGGMYNDHHHPTLANVAFVANSAARSGGGMANSYSDPLLVNVSFHGNAASSYGGGLAQSFSSPTLIHATFRHNSSPLGGAMVNDLSSPRIVNSILYADNGGEIHNISSSADVSYSIVQGGYPGAGNLDADPLLGPLQDNGGFTPTMGLGAGSPAIDAGDDAACPDADARGVPRPQDAHCDLGAYEAEGPIRVWLGGVPVNSYFLAEGESKRVRYAGITTGPVQIFDIEHNSLIAAERVIYRVNGVAASFAEMMGLPDGQLDTTYYLPWYNNVGLDTQLRFANVTGSTATVHVYIGGQEMQGSPFTLAPGESTRKSFPGVDAGPVKIVSDVDIVAAERLIYKANGVPTSFTETMALPASQLDSTYWLPWYNNKDLDTQLRFANVSNATATVHVYIGGEEMQGSPFTLAPGESTRKSFPGISDGPVQIVSDHGVPIVAAERLIYKANGASTSFSEMLALPDGQLDTTYWLPWYNNVGLDTQLRFANTTTSTATVHIYIGGAEMTGSPFTLLAGESTRKSFPGIDEGPVQIVSNVPIVAAERLIYSANGVATSFTEMMGLPGTQLDTAYWFPWYNNVDLDTQLRFGVP